MRFLIAILLLTGCQLRKVKYDPEAQERERQMWANSLPGIANSLQQSSQQEKREPTTVCTKVSIAPFAKPGCKNLCIKGQWQEYCPNSLNP
jgi:hypothetical protein